MGTPLHHKRSKSRIEFRYIYTLRSMRKPNIPWTIKWKWSRRYQFTISIVWAVLESQIFVPVHYGTHIMERSRNLHHVHHISCINQPSTDRRPPWNGKGGHTNQCWWVSEQGISCLNWRVSEQGISCLNWSMVLGNYHVTTHYFSKILYTIDPREFL